MFDLDLLRKSFPFSTIRPQQEKALTLIAKSTNGCVLELPTGEGKTAIGIAALRAAAKTFEGPLFYVTPTLTQAEQIAVQFPDDTYLMLGRSSHPCLYYADVGKPEITAQQSPCYMLNCAHRVNQETGQVQDPSVDPCPYYQEKFLARAMTTDRKIIVCTTAYFILNRLLVIGWKEMEPALVVLDEVHGIAERTRGLFENTVSDKYLKKASDIVRQFDEEQADLIDRFRSVFRSVVVKQPTAIPKLMDEQDVARIVEVLDGFSDTKIDRAVREAVANEEIDTVNDRELLETLSTLTRTIPRLVRQLKLASAAEKRGPLTYVVASYNAEADDESEDLRRSKYRLAVRSYFVAPLIKKAIGDRVLGLSATIGDAEVFSFETGIKHPLHTFGSMFSNANARIYMPKDTPNLSVKMRGRDDMKKALKYIADTALDFAQYGKRSLVVVVSEEERQQFLAIAARKGLDAVSYGNGVLATDAAEKFKSGVGQVLVGTVAHYAEGVDLPSGIAPVIFMLRPGFPRPDDPQTQFEERRYSKGKCWGLWTWRVMQRAVQVRGRNIRAAEDIGVCIFVSQQFRKMLYAGLPAWLQESYRGDMTTAQVLADTKKLLNVQEVNVA